MCRLIPRVQFLQRITCTEVLQVARHKFRMINDTLRQVVSARIGKRAPGFVDPIRKHMGSFILEQEKRLFTLFHKWLTSTGVMWYFRLGKGCMVGKIG